MTNDKITEYYMKDLSSSGVFENHIQIGDSKVNITVGNHLLLFDSSIKSYYKFKADGQLYEKLPMRTSVSGT